VDFLVSKKLRGGLGFLRLHACTHPRFTGDKIYNAALKGAVYRTRAMTDSRIRAALFVLGRASCENISFR
jgi:hypothetical protein